MSPERKVAKLFAENYPDFASQSDLFGDLVVHAVKEAFQTIARITETAPTPTLAALAQLSAFQLCINVAETELNKFKDMVD